MAHARHTDDVSLVWTLLANITQYFVRMPASEPAAALFKGCGAAYCCVALYSECKKKPMKIALDRVAVCDQQRQSSFCCQVAQTVEVAHVLPLLAQLGTYDGMVALALAKAKALDPETVAAQQSEAGRQAREVLCFGSSCAPCVAVMCAHFCLKWHDVTWHDSPGKCICSRHCAGPASRSGCPEDLLSVQGNLGASELDMVFSCCVLFAVDAWNCCDLQRRNEECYAPVVQILKYLVNNNLQEGTGAMLNQQGGLPAAAAEEAKAGILRVRLPAQSAVQHTPLESCGKHLLDIIAYALQGDYTTQCTIYITTVDSFSTCGAVLKSTCASAKQ